MSKIGKILSTIAFVCSIVGFCGCLVGLLGMAIGVQTLRLGGITLKNILQIDAGISTSAIYTAMAAGLILCAGEAVLAKFASHYFKRELQDATPFCLDGAKELLRLGILAICLPLGTQILARIVQAILAERAEGVLPLFQDCSSSIALGVMLILSSLLSTVQSGSWHTALWTRKLQRNKR